MYIYYSVYFITVALCNAIPFVGFGLLDNGIMILAVRI